MKIDPRDMEVGGTVLVVSRSHNTIRKQQARVLHIERAAARVAWIGGGPGGAKATTIKFCDLEADPEFLEARERKRLERERVLSEARATDPMRVTLAERTGALEAIAKLRESVPPAAGDEQKQSEQGSPETSHTTGVHEIKRAPEPAPSQASAETEDEEIARLEAEQGALLDMLEPIEERLKALKTERRQRRMRSMPAVRYVGGSR